MHFLNHGWKRLWKWEECERVDERKCWLNEENHERMAFHEWKFPFFSFHGFPSTSLVVFELSEYQEWNSKLSSSSKCVWEGEKREREIGWLEEGKWEKWEISKSSRAFQWISHIFHEQLNVWKFLPLLFCHHFRIWTREFWEISLLSLALTESRPRWKIQTWLEKSWICDFHGRYDNLICDWVERK